MRTMFYCFSPLNLEKFSNIKCEICYNNWDRPLTSFEYKYYPWNGKGYSPIWNSFTRYPTCDTCKYKFKSFHLLSYSTLHKRNLCVNCGKPGKFLTTVTRYQLKISKKIKKDHSYCENCGDIPVKIETHGFWKHYISEFFNKTLLSMELGTETKLQIKNTIELIEKFHMIQSQCLSFLDREAAIYYTNELILLKSLKRYL